MRGRSRCDRLKREHGGEKIEVRGDFKDAGERGAEKEEKAGRWKEDR